MADSSPWDRAVPVGDSSDPWSRAVPVAAPTGPGQGGIPTAAQEALQQPDIDPVSMVANAPTLGMPAVMGELARPFIHHYIGENVEKATGSPTAGLASEIVAPLAVGQLPKVASGALSAGRYIVGAPSSQELEEVGTAAAEKAQKALATGEGALTKPAEDVAQTQGAKEIIGAVGGDPAKHAAEAAAPFNSPELQRQSDLARQDAKASAVQPVSRLFRAKGAQIGQLLQDHAELPLSTETLPDTIGNIDSILKKNAYDISGPVNQELEQARAEGQAGNMTAGQAIGRLNKMQTMVGGLRSGRNESGDRVVLGNLRDHYENMVDSMVGDLPPETQKEYAALKKEYGALKGAFDTHGRDIYNEADQTGIAQKLLKLNKSDFGKVIAEANPEERKDLADSFARYITGDEENPDSAKVIERFNKVKSQNPEGFKALYGDTAYQNGSAWADTAKKSQDLLKDLKDKDLQTSLVSGWGLADKTPEAQALDAAIAKFKAIPKPQQEALKVQIDRIERGSQSGSERIAGYAKRRLIFDSILAAGGASAGVVAHNPGVAIGLTAALGTREALGSAIRKNPETYMNMLKRVNGTMQGMRQAGYFAARMSMADMAREIEDAMTGPQRQPQEQGQ